MTNPRQPGEPDASRAGTTDTVTSGPSPAVTKRPMLADRRRSGGTGWNKPRWLRRRWRATPSVALGGVLSAPLLLLLAIWVVVPFVQLWRIAVAPPIGLHALTSYFEQSSNLVILRTTFVDAAIVTAVSVLLGSIVAWSLRTTARTGVRFLLIGTISVSFLMGSVVKVYAFTVLLERLGVVNRLLLDLHIISQPLSLLYNSLAVVLGMIYQMLPYAAIPLYVAFIAIDTELLSVAESLGANRWRVFTSVVMPLGLPGVLATSVIVYVISLGFYLTPVILGGATSQFSANIISVDIFQFYNLSAAAVQALVLMAGAVVATVAGYVVVGRDRLARALG
jgi:ABC-type spermidine/putrescine transport system permease subunit I